MRSSATTRFLDCAPHPVCDLLAHAILRSHRCGRPVGLAVRPMADRLTGLNYLRSD